MNRFFFVARVCAAAAAAACASAGAVPVVKYYAHDLHDTSDGTFTTPAAMSRSGNIAGYTQPTPASPSTGFAVTPRTRFERLASVPGMTSQSGAGVNDRGQVVGRVASTVGVVQTSQAFVTGPNGIGITPLGLLDGNPTAASDINNAGQIVGSADSVTDNPSPHGGVHPLTCGPIIHVSHCFLTDAGGANMRDIGALVPGASCYANGINARGRVTGNSTQQPGDDCYVPTRAFLTGPGGVGFVDIDTLGGFSSYGYAVNASGMVAGDWEPVEFGNDSAFVTGPDGQGMRDLGNLGGSGTSAFALNADGNVVGTSSTRPGGGDSHAFVTGDNGVGLQDLNLITEGLPTVLVTASGIDDSGRIAARGENGHAYLLCPTRNCR